MRRLRWVIVALLALALLSTTGSGQAGQGEPKAPPSLSSFYDFRGVSTEFELGLGNIWRATCTVSSSTQPAVYAGNSLIDCDAEVPHDETTIVVNPMNPDHAVGGYHTFQLIRTGGFVHATVTGVVSVTFDGGVTWQEVIPPIAPYQFTGDPALAFTANERLHFANIADHEGELGFPFTGPSVIVSHSDDGGLGWSDPVTVAAGSGAVGSAGPNVFNDKEYIAADKGATSPFANRVYVTWTRFRFTPAYAGSPIFESHSDDGTTWSAPQKISGSHPACSTHFGDGTGTECNADQFSVPTVAPNGKVYVAFENFNTPAENQYMVVSSDDGGATWSPPVRVDTVFDINFPENLDGRSTLTGCQFRVNAAGNIASDTSDPTGRTVYLAWADNRPGSATKTNTDVLLARSTDGGQTWRVFTIDQARNDQFYAWVAVAPDGRVDVGYMDRSYSSGQDVCQYGFTLTRLTFNEHTGRISSKTRTGVDTGLSDPGHSRWFSFLTDGNALFIGDYNGVAIGSDGSTWSLWTDQRALVANPPSPTRTHGQHAVAARTAP